MKKILFTILLLLGSLNLQATDFTMGLLNKSVDVLKDSFKETVEKENYNKVNSNLSDDLFIKKAFSKANCDKTLSNDVLTSCYDYNYKGTKLVAYKIDGSNVHEGNIDERGKWYENKDIPTQHRSDEKDYIKTGYDKGHLAPDSAFDYSPRSLQQTYDVNLNSVPMGADVNRKTWIKAEKYSKTVAFKLGELTVIDVIVYDKFPKRIGHNQVAVPKGFYKILNNQKMSFQKCFYYENDLDVNPKNDKLEDHLVDCSKAFATIN